MTVQKKKTMTITTHSTHPTPSFHPFVNRTVKSELPLLAIVQLWTKIKYKSNKINNVIKKHNKNCLSTPVEEKYRKKQKKEKQKKPKNAEPKN